MSLYKQLFFPLGFFLLGIGFYLHFDYQDFKDKQTYIYSLESGKIENHLNGLFNYSHQFMIFLGTEISQLENFSPENIAAILRKSEQSNQRFLSWVGYDFVMPDGEVIASSQQGVLEKTWYVKPENRQWMGEAPNKPWELIFSPVDDCEVCGRIIPAGMGITNAQGEFVGTISTGFKTHKIREFLNSSISSPNFIFALLDLEWNLVLSSESHTEPMLIDNLTFSDNTGNFELTKSIEIENKEYLTLQSLTELPFRMLVGQTKSFLIQYWESAYKKILFLFLSMIVFTGLFYRFYQQILRPIQQILHKVSPPSQSHQNVQCINEYIKRVTEEKNSALSKYQESELKLKKAKDSYRGNVNFFRTHEDSVRTNAALIHQSFSALIQQQKGGIRGSAKDEKHLLKDVQTCVNDILLYSTQKQGFFQEIKLNQVLEEVLSTSWLWSEEKNLQIITQWDQSLPLILGDSFQLKAVLLNLWQNYIHVCQQNDKIRITIKHEPLVEGLHSLSLIISNGSQKSINWESFRHLVVGQNLDDILAQHKGCILFDKPNIPQNHVCLSFITRSTKSQIESNVVKFPQKIISEE